MLPSDPRVRQAPLLALAVFAVHAVPAGPGDVVVGQAPLAGAAGQRVQLRLPEGFAAVPGRPGTYVQVVAEGLARCGTEVAVEALASRRGVRFEPATSVLAYRLRGRQALRVAQRATRGARSTWRTAADRLAVGTPPAVGVVRFPGPGARSTLVRVSVSAFADTSSPVQRTPGLLGACSRRARRVAPLALDAALGSAEVTSARRGAP